MDTNVGNGIHGRRSASRATKLRRRRKRMNLLILAGFAAAVVLIVLITPREPLQRAVYSIATEDGRAGNGARLVTRYEGLVLSEIMPSNRSAVTDENGEYPDWVEIWNSSDHAMDLKGVGLSDRSDSIRFLFPGMTLPADGRVVVFCSNSNQTAPDLPYHAKFKLSSVGETVYLYDPNAYLIDSCKYPIMASDESWALTDGGYRTVESAGTEYEQHIGKIPGAVLKTFDGQAAVGNAVAEEMDGVVAGLTSINGSKKLANTVMDAEGKPMLKYFQLDMEGIADNYSMAFPKGSELKDLFNEQLQAMIDSGELNTMIHQWLY